MNKKLEPNCFARIKSEEIWSRYLSESTMIGMWILTCNFFFGVLPGILFFITNVRISQEPSQSLPNILPDFRHMVSWFGIIFVLFPIFISIFQIFVFHRLISLRMTRTFFVGQIVGLILYMCSFSKTILKKFHWFKKKITFISLTIILLIIVMSCVFVPYLFLFSEVFNYSDKTCLHKKRQQQEFSYVM